MASLTWTFKVAGPAETEAADLLLSLAWAAEAAGVDGSSNDLLFATRQRTGLAAATCPPVEGRPLEVALLASAGSPGEVAERAEGIATSSAAITPEAELWAEL